MLLELCIQRRKKAHRELRKSESWVDFGVSCELPLVLLIKGSPGDKSWPTGHYALHGRSTVGDMPIGV